MPNRLMAYLCWACGKASHNANDEREGFCGLCGTWAADRDNLAKPHYWMAEQSGKLRPAIEAMIRGDALSPSQVTVIRAYLRQWIFAGVWHGREIGTLRATIPALEDRESVMQWIVLAGAAGADPL